MMVMIQPASRTRMRLCVTCLRARKLSSASSVNLRRCTVVQICSAVCSTHATRMMNAISRPCRARSAPAAPSGATATPSASAATTSPMRSGRRVRDTRLRQNRSRLRTSRVRNQNPARNAITPTRKNAASTASGITHVGSTGRTVSTCSDSASTCAPSCCSSCSMPSCPAAPAGRRAASPDVAPAARASGRRRFGKNPVAGVSATPWRQGMLALPRAFTFAPHLL